MRRRMFNLSSRRTALKKDNKERSSRRKDSFPIWFKLGFVLLILGVVHFKIEDSFLKYYGRCTKGFVTDRVRYARGTNSYYFEFAVEGKVYEGDSWLIDPASIGDTLEVVYLPLIPWVNRSVIGYYGGDFQCPKAGP